MFNIHLDGYTKESPSSGKLDLDELRKRKPVIVCGDMNVAYAPIDLARPKQNEGNPGYSEEERAKFGQLLDSGFVDSFRYLHPTSQEYSWYSYRANAREKGIGWRIDYFLVSDFAKEQIKTAAILNEIQGSDHVPVLLDMDFT